jgi:hypothetical protein
MSMNVILPITLLTNIACRNMRCSYICKHERLIKETGKLEAEVQASMGCPAT